MEVLPNLMRPGCDQRAERLQQPVATRPSTLTGLFNAARIGRDNVTFGHLFVLVNAILQFYVWGKD